METFDDGIMIVCDLVDEADPGNMPQPMLVVFKRYYFQDRMVTYNRAYAALGVNEHVDRLVRVWQDKTIRIGMYAVIDGEQYRITNCEQLFNKDNLKVTDITLSRLGENYDFDSAANVDPGCSGTAHN